MGNVPIRKGPKPPRPVVKAKKGGGVQPSKARQAVFLCPRHHSAMVYNSKFGLWMCGEADCGHTRRAEAGGDHSASTKLTGFPKLIAQQDEDGDWHYFMHYSDQNITVELPFVAVVGHTALVRSTNPKVVVNMAFEDFTFMDRNGNLIPSTQIKDR